MDHWNVVTDIVTSAKSLAAGMPLSAVFEIIDEENLLEKAQVLGEKIDE
jgi:4-aminobutyrate aminotransferase-like enzyme